MLVSIALVLAWLGIAAALHCVVAVRISAFTEHLILDYNLGAIDAMRANWRITRGRTNQLMKLKLKLWLIQLVSCIPSLGIGIFLIQPYVSLVWTAAYVDLAGAQPLRDDLEQPRSS